MPPEGIREGLPTGHPVNGYAEGVDFIRNLRRSGLTHVITYDAFEGGRLMPPQHQLLAGSGLADRVADWDGHVLWRLRPE